MSEEKNLGGRPRKYNDPAQLYSEGRKYIDDCINNGQHLTFTGLCIALGMVKDTFYDYESGKYDNNDVRFSDSLKDLKQRCENYAEQRLFANNPTGAIFALKNYGWKDKQEVEINPDSDGVIKVSFVKSDE